MSTLARLISQFLESHSYSVRSFSLGIGINDSDLHRILKGDKRMTLASVHKLLAYVDGQYGRGEALRFLKAYLEDQTPEEFADNLSITVSAGRLQEVPMDPLEVLARKWLAKAKGDGRFSAWWLEMDALMHGDAPMEPGGEVLVGKDGGCRVRMLYPYSDNLCPPPAAPPATHQP